MGLRNNLKKLFGKNFAAEDFEALEDLLIEADFGPALSVLLVNSIRDKKPKNEEEAIDLLKNEIRPYLKEGKISLQVDKLNFILLLGVNGVGKTTSIAKLTKYANEKLGVKKLCVAAGDTFRAAASEQLSLWSERYNFRLVKSSQNADPGSVMHDAISSAVAHKDELVLADTAGRMHNKQELIRELQKINKIITERVNNQNYFKFLVLDGTTGQNALQQTEVFHSAIELSGIILSKYDSKGKGGNLVAIGKKFNLPIYFLGTGEKIDNLEEFSSDKYLDDLFS